jgi:hypothetical protein
MPENVPRHAGLCATCRHARLVTNDRGSVFVRCGYAALDPSFAKYPRLPVMACAAYRQDDGADGDTPAPSSSR